jgi:hypothetical protein
MLKFKTLPSSAAKYLWNNIGALAHHYRERTVRARVEKRGFASSSPELDPVCMLFYKNLLAIAIAKKESGKYKEKRKEKKRKDRKKELPLR